MRNDNGNQNDLLRVRTVGSRSNRDGIGAKVTLKTQAGGKMLSVVKTGSSYCSQSELPLTFGLGKTDPAKGMTLEVVWPSGQTEIFQEVKPNQSITIQEGKGIISAAPIVFVKPAAQPSPSPTPAQ